MSETAPDPLASQLTVRCPEETGAALDALAVRLAALDGKPVTRAEAHRRALLAGIVTLSNPDHDKSSECFGHFREDCNGSGPRGNCSCSCHKAVV